MPSKSPIKLAAFIHDWLAEETNQPGWGTYVGGDEPLTQLTLDGEVNLVGLSSAIIDRLSEP